MLVTSFLTMRTGNQQRESSHGATDVFSTTNSDKSPLNTLESRRDTLGSYARDEDRIYQIDAQPANASVLTKTMTR
jgi:hypothetical protein